jgi:hypothetical protein
MDEQRMGGAGDGCDGDHTDIVVVLLSLLCALSFL